MYNLWHSNKNVENYMWVICVLKTLIQVEIDCIIFNCNIHRTRFFETCSFFFHLFPFPYFNFQVSFAFFLITWIFLDMFSSNLTKVLPIQLNMRSLFLWLAMGTCIYDLMSYVPFLLINDIFVIGCCKGILAFNAVSCLKITRKSPDISLFV